LNQQVKAYNWSLAHAIVVLFTTSFVLHTNNMTVFSFVIFLSFCIYIANNFSLLKSIKPFGGYANWITFLRLIILIYVALNFQNMAYVKIASIFIANILLDILDGIVARKLNIESIFGLYFDMELDAFYVCLAAIILFTEGLTGSWIVWIGLLRYLFTFLMVLLNINIKSEPKQKFASLVAGALFWCLLLPFFNTQFNFILMMASVLVMVSFTKSFIFQLKRSF